MASSSSALAAVISPSSSSTASMTSGTPMPLSTATTTQATPAGLGVGLNHPNTIVPTTTNTNTSGQAIVPFEDNFQEEQKFKFSEFDQYLGEVPLPLCQEKIEKGNITTRINLTQYKHNLSYLRPGVREFINEKLQLLKFMLDLSCGGNTTFSGQVVNLVMHAKMNVGQKEPEVWFYVNNKPVRFGKQEFFLVSGLSFNKNEGARDRESDVNWTEKYFPEHKMGNNIKIAEVESALDKLKKLAELTPDELYNYTRPLMGCLIGPTMYVRINSNLMGMAPLGLLSDFSWEDKFGWGQYWWDQLIADVGQEVWKKKIEIP